VVVPYYQFFCGELSFCHKLPFDRSSLTHWRQRLGGEQLLALGSWSTPRCSRKQSPIRATRRVLRSQPRHFAVKIAVRVGYGPIAPKAEPIEETTGRQRPGLVRHRQALLDQRHQLLAGASRTSG
jgi:hypothetical protein